MALELRASSDHHTLDPLDRFVAGVLAEMRLWPTTHLAVVFGVGPSTIRKHQRRYGQRANAVEVTP